MIDDNIDKLTILYLMDRMEVSLVDEMLTSICSIDNDWMPYINCKHAIGQLCDSAFIHQSKPNGKTVLNITPEGRLCIASFYTRIPMSRREEIVEFVKNRKIEFRKKQDIDSDYYLNKDGTYTVHLSINDSSSGVYMLDLKISAESKNNARYACNSWESKAASIYEMLYEHLFD